MRKVTRARHAQRVGSGGFTLVELLIVVVIVGVLAAVAGPTFFRQRARALAVEAPEVLTQVMHAQEAYRAEFNMFADVSNDLSLASPTTEGSTGNFGTHWPALGAAAGAPGAQANFYASLPVAWNQLGVRPRQFVRFAYQTIAGNPGVAPIATTSSAAAYAALPTAARGQWYLAAAWGDLDRDGAYSRFEVSSFGGALQVTGDETE
jgi:prepilin-type N-terminal cleavage/methylation domain-containing protein